MPVVCLTLHHTQAADGIDEKKCGRLGDQASESCDVMADSGGGFTERGAYGQSIWMFSQCPSELLGLHGLSVGDGDDNGFDAEGLTETAPAFAKTASNQANGFA